MTLINKSMFNVRFKKIIVRHNRINIISMITMKFEIHHTVDLHNRCRFVYETPLLTTHKLARQALYA